MCNSHFLRYILHQRYTNICGIILLEIVAVLTQVPKLNIMPMVFPLSFVVSNNITPVRSLDHIIIVQLRTLTLTLFLQPKN